MGATRDIGTVLTERVLPSGSTRRGLVIGIENYRDSRLNLRCARADKKSGNRQHAETLRTM